jgi:hypothetical protein
LEWTLSLHHDPSAPLPDAFEGPKLKIERAKHHIRHYRAAFKAFSESKIIRFQPEADAQTGDRFKIWLAEPLPGDLRLTAADALYNMRSALDQAVCRCAVLAGKSPKETYFPHESDKAGFEVSLRSKCEKVPELVRRTIADLEPYHGGNGYLLRVLHDLNLVDKHTDLIAVGMTVRRLAISPGKGEPPTSEVWRRTENSFEIDPTATEVDQHVKITVAISFADIQAIQGEPVAKILRQLCDFVAKAVEIIEAAMTVHTTTMVQSTPSEPS